LTVSNIANTFNTILGVGEVENFSGVVTFQAAATPNGVLDQTEQLLEVKNVDYYWLGMNYLIVTGTADNVKVDVTLNTNMGSVNHVIDNVPVKENYRTNILGNLLTTGAQFNIEIDADFDGENDVIMTVPETIVLNSSTETIANASALNTQPQTFSKGFNIFSI
jgi:hypothetical protein